MLWGKVTRPMRGSQKSILLSMGKADSRGSSEAIWVTHCSVPREVCSQVVSANEEALLRPMKLGVSSDRMTAVPTHGSMSSFLEAL